MEAADPEQRLTLAAHITELAIQPVPGAGTGAGAVTSARSAPNSACRKIRCLLKSRAARGDSPGSGWSV
jgi:hypothetical protein